MLKRKSIKSLGLILDGNRRWSVKNGYKKKKGHEHGMKKIFKTIDWAKDFNIENITFYVFSSENWNRSKMEVSNLILLFEKLLTGYLYEIQDKNVAMKFIGNLERFPKKIQKLMKDWEEKTKNNKIKVFFAISYGGREEIINAVKKVSEKLSKKDILNITEKKFETFLYSANIPDPEIIIRTGGCKRLSNFLLWKSAYSEIFFLNKLWPDFSKKDLKKVLEEYLKVKINGGK